MRRIPETRAQQTMLTKLNSDLKTTWSSGRSIRETHHVWTSIHSHTDGVDASSFLQKRLNCDRFCPSPACGEHNPMHRPTSLLATLATCDSCRPYPACGEHNKPGRSSLLPTRSAPDESRCPPLGEHDHPPHPGLLAKHPVCDSFANSSRFQGFCSLSPRLIDLFMVFYSKYYKLYDNESYSFVICSPSQEVFHAAWVGFRVLGD